MSKYEISFIGEDFVGGVYEGAIVWDRGYFVIHSNNGERTLGYIPLSAIKIMILVKEKIPEEHRRV